MQKSVILFSGGLDSGTLVALAHQENYELYILSFDYGQRHRIEIKKSEIFLKDYPVKERKLICLSPDIFKHSSLVSGNNFQEQNVSKTPSQEKIPFTYVPARNTLFLSYALAWAESLLAQHIFIGVNAIDYSGYPDCRPKYIEAFSAMAQLATKMSLEGKKIHIHTPLISLTKSEIIQLGLSLNVNYDKTHSCYFPLENGEPCEQCESCFFRNKGFEAVSKKNLL